MRRLPLFAFVLATSLAIAPSATFGHAGHGDEFQATGGVNRVEVKAETDTLLGIQANSIDAAADGSDAILIPITALVDDNGRQLVFVQHENFYEPVDVTLGETQGDLIAVTEGLSPGEKLVTQGSLSLYAESRKTQSVEASESSNPPEGATAEAVVAEATESSEAEAPSGGLPWGAIAGAIVVLGGVGLAIGLGSKKQSS